jgi:hypothetical protein
MKNLLCLFAFVIFGSLNSNSQQMQYYYSANGNPFPMDTSDDPTDTLFVVKKPNAKPTKETFPCYEVRKISDGFIFPLPVDDKKYMVVKNGMIIETGKLTLAVTRKKVPCPDWCAISYKVIVLYPSDNPYTKTDMKDGTYYFKDKDKVAFETLGWSRLLLL